MIYHHFYSELYQAVARTLHKVLNADKITPECIAQAIQTSTDSEEILNTLNALIDDKDLDNEITYERERQHGSLITRTGQVPKTKPGTALDKYPDMPLTTLEYRFLKTIANDPRMQLFDFHFNIPQNIEPLYRPEDIRYFDRPDTADPWTDANYIKHFKTILSAIDEGDNLEISWLDRDQNPCYAICIPERIEYDMAEDKMRLWASTDTRLFLVNLCRIQHCEVSDSPMAIKLTASDENFLPDADYLDQQQLARENAKTLNDAANTDAAILTLLITDTAGALERTLALFSHYQKHDIQKLPSPGEATYRLELCFDALHDSNDILQKLLYSGPYVKALSPAPLVKDLKARLKRQRAFNLNPLYHVRKI
ncbi:MAG: hypothetical protein IJ268_06430 [Proteobacteria bacterium]|nr:hypothetical protein [Pseudomonadota bacterium]